jgi:hypothetical protein
LIIFLIPQAHFKKEEGMESIPEDVDESVTLKFQDLIMDVENNPQVRDIYGRTGMARVSISFNTVQSLLSLIKDEWNCIIYTSMSAYTSS